MNSLKQHPLNFQPPKNKTFKEGTSMRGSRIIVFLPVALQSKLSRELSN